MGCVNFLDWLRFLYGGVITAGEEAVKLFCLIVVTSSVAFANSYDQSSWERWKKDTYSSYQSDPKSFLNATSLAFAGGQQRLYLKESSSLEQTRWSRTPVKGFVAVAKNLRTKGLLTRAGKKDQQVDAATKRFDWKLKNGGIAEVVYGSSSQKVWGYIYDPEQIKKFSGFRFYPFNRSAVVAGEFRPAESKPVSYRTVQGDHRQVYVVGQVSFTLHGKSFRLPAYNWQPPDEKINYIALIYTDTQAGRETYGGGRELVVNLAKPPTGKTQLTLDFNRTSNFYCAHSPFWHCPTGLQKPLTVAVKAGEMLPIKKIATRVPATAR